MLYLLRQLDLFANYIQYKNSSKKKKKYLFISSYTQDVISIKNVEDGENPRKTKLVYKYLQTICRTN